jgi:hypothetical protein
MIIISTTDPPTHARADRIRYFQLCVSAKNPMFLVPDTEGSGHVKVTSCGNGGGEEGAGERKHGKRGEREI